MITFKHRGSFSKTERFLNTVKLQKHLNVLDDLGAEGVRVLSEATPKKTGKTAASWTYEIQKTEESTTIAWLNTNTNQGVTIALILQYGHGTGTGGFVQGIDYINPAMRPVFDEIANRAWKEVTKA